jgi:methylase of polypeptide subunit release factors
VWCGSGTIGLTYMRECAVAKVVGIDSSDQVLRNTTIMRNAEKNGGSKVFYQQVMNVMSANHGVPEATQYPFVVAVLVDDHEQERPSEEKTRMIKSLRRSTHRFATQSKKYLHLLLQPHITTTERRRSSLCPCLKEETQRAAIQDYIRPTCWQTFTHGSL